MGIPFRELADDQADIVRWEEHRIDLTHALAVQGGCEPPPAVAFAGWRKRLRGLKAASRLLEELAAGRLALVPGPSARDAGHSVEELVRMILVGAAR